MLKEKIDLNANLTAINFTKLNDDDKLKILDMRNDIRVAKYMFLDRKITKKEHFEFIKKLDSTNNRIYFAIKNKKDELLGVISLTNITNLSAYIGIYTNPNATNGSLLMRCIKHIGFKKMGLKILFAQCLKNNHKALRFYEKEGFKEIKTLKNYIKKNNIFIDVVELVLNKE